ncbi:YegP family protein [Candidatus Bathyarchaeota archaeon]|nr:YegP family protein [Candidatus Bathyarchaeota archaeon]
MNSVFEVFRDKKGKFRFRLKAANGKIIATSEDYETKRECFRGIESVRVNVANATTRDIIH